MGSANRKTGGVPGKPPCPKGSICSGQSRTFVGRETKTETFNPRGARIITREKVINPGTGIYHASATKLNSDGTSTTDVYIIKDGEWQKAATSNDGGKTYTFDDDVAGAGLKKELSDPQGAMHKNVDANINKAADKAGVPPSEKAKLLDSNKNVETAEGDETDPGQTAQAEQAQTEDAEGGVRPSYGNSTYPLELATTKQDYIKFSMVRYQPKGLSTSSGSGTGAENLTGVNFGGRTKAEDRNIMGTVTLPIQSGIQDENNVDWGENQLSAIQANFAAAAESVMNAGVAGAESSAQNIGNTIQANSAGVKQQIVSSLAAAAVGADSKSLFTRTTGAIVNPNLELLFNGPQLRTFSFNFVMSARENREAQAIRKIIRFFKQGMTVKRAKSSLYLKSPNTFAISYVYARDGKPHPWMNRIKECALTACTVDYTPLGNFSTYEDGAMVQYNLGLTFSELEPLYDDDYTTIDQNSDTSIGF